MRFSSTGLVVDGPVPAHPLPAFADAVLRGIGQVMLQNNSYAGLVFLLGMFGSAPLLGLAMLAGTVVSTGTALLLGMERSQVRAGWFGFNGALVVAALLHFFQADAWLWLCALGAAAVTTVLMAALLRLLATWQLPALTAPFVFATLCCVGASAHWGLLHARQHLPGAAGLPQGAAPEGGVGLGTVAEGVFNGVAQVFFQGNVLAGTVITHGLLIGSRAAAASALLGSRAGLLVGWGMGATEPALRLGACGFNSALAAVALCGMAPVLNASVAAHALLAALATAVVHAAVSAVFEPLGMPALTLPFVLVTWMFLRALPQCRRPDQAAAETGTAR